MLTLHRLASSFDGPNLYNNRRDFFFRVDGLPGGEEAQVRESYGRWQMRRRTGDDWTEWQGEHSSKEEALASLSAEHSR